MENPPEFVHFTVPYLARTPPFIYNAKLENGDLSGYPSRRGWKLPREDRTNPIHIAFFQGWLFFGLLSTAVEKLGLTIDITTEFVVGDEVSTRALDGLAARLVAAAKAQDPAGWKKTVLELGDLVTIAYRECDANMTTMDGMDKWIKSLDFAQCRVLLSIRMLLMVLLVAISSAEEKGNTGIVYRLWLQLYGAFAILKDRLADFGREVIARDLVWCRSELNLLSRPGLKYTFFASLLGREGGGGRHHRCTTTKCLADQIDDEDNYITAHTEAGCNCDFLEVAGMDLANVLGKERVPRILISDALELKVTDDGPYVAISHVWSHGLGNPHRNALPSCQIRRMRDQIFALSGKKSTALWIDTLCVPVAESLRPFRKQAILLMAGTYAAAESVLVLDRELQRLDLRRVSEIERNLRITCCGWLRRLWTLQEALLAQSLHYQFLNTTLTHSALGIRDRRVGDDWRPVEEPANPMVNRIPNLDLLRRPFHTFLTLGQAIEGRSTSRAEDEPIVIASVLGINVKAILNEDGAEARMARLYLLLGTLPMHIIFHSHISGLLMERRPFRWAPLSLSSAGVVFIPNPGKCDEAGLHVNFLGFVVEEGWNGEDVGGGKYCLVDVARAGFRSVALRASRRIPSGRIAVIWAKVPDSFFHAVLVEIEREEVDDHGKVYYATIVAPASVSRESGEPAEGARWTGRWTGGWQRWCIT